MLESDRIALVVANVRRLIWATTTEHIFLSLVDPASKKEVDPTPELIEAFEADPFTVYPFAEAQVLYPNGVLHRDDYRVVGVWVSVRSIREFEDGDIEVKLRFYATHLTNFERIFRWRLSEEGWLQVVAKESVP